MPEHLVERINASLAAEQAQRAARTSNDSVTPLLATLRRRPGRLVFAMAGAAAAVALVAVVGSNMLTVNQPTSTSGGAAIASTSNTGTSNTQEASGGAPTGAEDKAAALPGRAATASPVQIRLSGTRYTQADFLAQVRTLRSATPAPPQLQAASSVGPAGTALGLTECLRAIGAAGAQVVRADVAFYEGRPAVIIVTTTSGIPTAYVVGRQCSRADAAVLRPATPLP